MSDLYMIVWNVKVILANQAANVTVLCFLLLRSSQLQDEENPLQDPQHDARCPQAEGLEQKS